MKFYFASSSKVWEDPAWVSGIVDAGFDGWEISADGNYRLDNETTFAGVKNTIKETGLEVSVHAPFSDLNPASINLPIWEETVNQLSVTITRAAEIADTVVIHPGYLSPVSRYDTALAWQNHKQACIRLGEVAESVGVKACLENMPNLDDFFCRDPYEQDGFVDGTGMGPIKSWEYDSMFIEAISIESQTFKCKPLKAGITTLTIIDKDGLELVKNIIIKEQE